jgi:zinc transport system substrate-binding protein
MSFHTSFRSSVSVKNALLKKAIVVQEDRPMKKKTLFSLVVICMAALIILSCQKKQDSVPQSTKLSIVATLFPIYDFAREIVGDKATVTLLLPPGVEAHSFEPKPGDMITINNAGIFLYTGKYMEPWVEKIIQATDNKNLIIIDTSKGVNLRKGTAGHEEEGYGQNVRGHNEHGAYDPHIWLDFANAQKMVDSILEGLTRQDPVNKDIYAQNAAAYKTKLQALDEKFKNTLSGCKKDTFVHSGHFAFNYLASRYNLHYISAYGGSPNAEPTPGKIIELKKFILAHAIKYIYYEALITPRIADILNKETGAQLLKLNGTHNIGKDDLKQGKTFIGLMEDNLTNLKVGLECQ